MIKYLCDNTMFNMTVNKRNEPKVFNLYQPIINNEKVDLSDFKFMWELYVKDADAAITAMREPTEAMLDAGAYDLDMKLETQWQRMIDAALKE